MLDIEIYKDRLLSECRKIYGDRLMYVGLQGSYMRGEAGENSDLDFMVIIDRFSVQDMDEYREILKRIGDYDKSCGFICGKEEMKQWNPLEVCQLLHTTKDLFGVLSEFLPEATLEDEVNYVNLSLGNLYHELCHRYIHSDREKNVRKFRGTCKGFFFLIQNLYFLESGVFVSTKRELKQKVSKEDSEILSMAELPDDYDFDKAYDSLFKWCQNAFERIKKVKVELNSDS